MLGTMRKPAVAVLFALLGCSTPSRLPECWTVTSPLGTGSSAPFAQVGAKLWLLTSKHSLPLSRAGGLPIVDTIPHPTRDLALVSVVGTANYLAPLATKLPRYGDQLHTAGNQHGAILISLGYQGSRRGSMSCAIAFGASGGPVWNTRGELVGVVMAITMAYNSKGGLYAVAHVSHYEPVVNLRTWIMDSIR